MENNKDLFAALAKFQGEVENAEKNAANPHLKSKYANLAECLNTVRPLLAKYGLAIVQMPTYADGMVTVKTMITHESGQFIESELSLPVLKNDPQGVGSAITYCRRYSVTAMTGISQEDDDGHAASKPPSPEEIERQRQSQLANWRGQINNCTTIDQLRGLWPSIPKNLLQDLDQTINDKRASFAPLPPLSDEDLSAELEKYAAPLAGNRAQVADGIIKRLQKTHTLTPEQVAKIKGEQ